MQAAVLLLLLTSKALAVDIETTVQPSTLYKGESVTLTVRVPDFKEGMEPDLDNLPADVVTLQGQQDQSIQRIAIVNGKQVNTGFSGRVFQYRVVPSETGSYALGPITLRAKGQVYTVEGPTITVNPIPEQETVLMFLEAPDRPVIAETAFELILRVLVRRLPPPFTAESPLPEAEPPHLSIPYLNIETFDHLEGPSVDELLSPLLIASGEGFLINNYTATRNADPFGGFFSPPQREARFRLERHAVIHNGAPYYEYRLPVRYTPLREGEFNFGPVAFRGRVYTNATPQGKGIAKQIYAVADAVTVQTAMPPSKNRPETYIGAIGSNLTVQASIDPQTCQVGDPLTLEISIAGDMRTDQIVAPRLDVQPGLQRDFRLYTETARRQSSGDGVQYRFLIRPIRSGTLEFPPVSISYFDTAEAVYRTRMSQPIPIRALPATELQEDFLIRADEQSISLDAHLGNGNKTVPAPVRVGNDITADDAFFIPRLHLPLLLAGPLFFLLVNIIVMARGRWPAIRRFHARRTAGAQALRHLYAAEDHAAQAVVQILRTYLCAHFGRTVRAATPTECARLLTAQGINHRLARQTAILLEAAHTATLDTLPGECPVFADGEDTALDPTALIKALDAELKPGWKPAFLTRATTSLILGALLLPAGASGGISTIDRFESNRAMAALMHAQEPEDFASAASTFAELIEQGAANADLFYNYGTALLLAGQPETALEALRRAERYGGSDWDIRRNLVLALRALDEESPAPLAWQRIPLFWHYGLPANSRITVATAAFSCLWLLMLLRSGRLRAFALPAAAIVAFIALLFGASAFSSWYQEHQDRQQHTIPQWSNTP